MGVQLLVLVVLTGIVDYLRCSHGTALPWTCLHNHILVTFTYSPVKVMLKLVDPVSAVKLLPDELVLSDMVIKLPY